MADALFTRDNHGYWSRFAPPSTVEWCETNYAICWCVAEFFNSGSSLAIVAAGALGLGLNRAAELRFKLAYSAVIAVGLGSIAFHATLLRPMQMLDEVPMLYSAQAMVYCIVENDNLTPRYPWLPSGNSCT